MPAFLEDDVPSAIEALHDMTLSGDPTMACGARLAKRIASVMESWIADERLRGTHGTTLVLSAPHVAIMVLFTTIVNVAEPDKRIEIALKMQPLWDELYDEALKTITPGQAG